MAGHAPEFLRVAQEAKSRVRETNVEEVARRRAAGEQFVLIDVREDNEWEKGHAAGAVHIGKGVIERDIEKLYPDKSTELVLYCGGGYRSALATDMLQRMGYTNVLSMDGGFKGWKAASLPLEGGSGD